MKQIILTGSLSVDRIMNFGGKYEEMIQKDKLHVLSLSVLIDSLTDSPGGTAGNIAYNLGLLGASPRLFGVIGNNDQGYLTRLRALGVNTDEVHLSPLATATYTVMTDSADNQVGGFFPGAMTDYETVTLSRVSPDNAFVVVSANDRGAMQKYVMEAKQLRIPFVYDPGQQVNNIEGGDIREGVTSCQILMINDYEMGVIVEKTGMSLEEIESTVPVVVVTLGSQGSKISGHDVESEIVIPALPGIKVVDPTGAGDAYRGGFLYGFAHGWPVSDCARLGSITASFAVAVKGTQEHVFTLAGLKDLYYDNYRITYPNI